MNILFLSLTFSPDNVSTAQIMAGLAEDFARAGNCVKVLTSTPHYHRDSSMEAKQPLRPWLGRLVQKSNIGDVEIYHFWMPNKKIFPLFRIISWIGFHLMTILISPFIHFKPDVIIACTPPLTMGVNSYIISKLLRSKYIFNVQEIYPDIAVNLGILKNKGLIRFFSKMERFIYRHAAAVTTITEAMAAKIRSRTDASKVRLIPNFVDLEEMTSLSAIRENDFAKEHGLINKFVITYAGNMGVPQNLGILVEAGKLLPENFVVLLVGGGGDEKRLREIAGDSKRIIFVDYQPISAMPSIYAVSDLFYVGQSPDAAADGIPSKIYRILGNKKPILAVTGEQSDLAVFVRKANAGFVFNEISPKALADEIVKMASNREKLKACGMAGYTFVASQFGREAISKAYLNLLNELQNSRV